MEIFLHKDFKKKFFKLPKKTHDQFRDRYYIFVNDHFDSILNNHPLKGPYAGYRSITINGNIRALYKIKDTMVVFSHIGSHNELYS